MILYNHLLEAASLYYNKNCK